MNIDDEIIEKTRDGLVWDETNKVWICPKCKYSSGNNWSQCNGKCPVKGSPHYTIVVENKPYIPPLEIIMGI